MSEQKSKCSHVWRRVHEQFLMGGSFPIGWECKNCGKFLALSEVTPAGIPGKVTKEHVLVGPHGGYGNTSDGSLYKRQIIDEDGNLTIER